TLCDALVLHGFLGAAPPRPRFLRVLEAQVVGRAINVITPLASLGEATKAAMLMRHTDTDRAVATVVRFNLSYVAVNLSFIIIGAPICAAALPLPAWIARTLWIGTGAAVAVGVALGLIVRAGLVASAIRVLRALRLVSRKRFDIWRARLRRLDVVTRGEHGLRSWLPGLWALPSKALMWVGAWLVLYANGEPPSLGVMAALASAGTLINAASNVVPLGLGVSEGGTAALMAALGGSPTLGVTIVLSRRVVFLAYAAVGLLVLGTDTGAASIVRRKP
ncbi:MAG TPA: lysylphosphatidylglycerol synthase transmembrane domain-containing protein, partial [Kofleriaceae bacterium]|nr:lysylphosphatidylglycerol synthase transmembrane domain-containing protein [Kofleriaceae bacterium]